MNNSEYKAECERLCGLKEVQRILSVNPELSPDFLGFLGDYKELAGLIPKDAVIVDLGCNSAIQATYFTAHRYIGVDTIPIEHRFNGASYCAGVYHLKMTIQDFCKHIDELRVDGEKPESIFAFCCNVPDNENNRVWELVSSTFKFYCITYPGESMRMVLP